MYLNFSTTFELGAPPDRVFPLLCPQREHDWIPTWRAQIVHSHSGFAELDCVFTTDSPHDGHRTWVCTRFEPSRVVEYAAFSSLGYVMHLAIELVPIRDVATNVSWSRRFIASNDQGRKWMEALTPEGLAGATRGLAQLLEHFLRTGSMLKA
jgi:hypothetical protein